jgi:hypothetical protein
MNKKLTSTKHHIRLRYQRAANISIRNINTSLPLHNNLI